MTQKAARKFLQDLTSGPSTGETGLFKELHSFIRSTMLGFAEVKGYDFSAEDLQAVLWEYGLGHEQVKLEPEVEDVALDKLEERFAKEDSDPDRRRPDSEKETIRTKVKANLGEWENNPQKSVDSHTAFIVVHSAAN